MSFVARLAARLEDHRTRGLYRSRREACGSQRPWLELAEGPRINFSSNDYLGLASHGAVVDAMKAALSRYGAGAAASHLVSGHMTPHRQLEQRLAEVCGTPRALLFSSGYQANLALLSVLAGRRTLVLSDRLNHASLIDAGILSRARVKRYRHLDADQVAEALADHVDEALIVTDSVFSMDGDIAPLARLDRIAESHGAPLVVDDAHGFGVLGDGRGAIRHFGLSDHAVMMGTLGKAVGVYGAFVAAGDAVIESLIQFARPYTYTTALPPAVAAGVLAALELLEGEPWRRERLRHNIDRFRAAARKGGIEVAESTTPIQPLLLGASRTAVDVSHRLESEGFLVTAIRPPTVAEGSARLRIALSAAHTDIQIDDLVDSLSRALEDRA